MAPPRFARSAARPATCARQVAGVGSHVAHAGHAERGRVPSARASACAPRGVNGEHLGDQSHGCVLEQPGQAARRVARDDAAGDGAAVPPVSGHEFATAMCPSNGYEDGCPGRHGSSAGASGATAGPTADRPIAAEHPPPRCLLHFPPRREPCGDGAWRSRRCRAAGRPHEMHVRVVEPGAPGLSGIDDSAWPRHARVPPSPRQRHACR
jgi:hypothetical protein